MKTVLKLLKLSSRWTLAIKVLPFVGAVIILKFVVHYLGAEFLSLSSLFTALISANIFLIGFLISGVLVDYKESEKIPGEIATSISAITDECEIIYASKKAKPAKECLEHIKKLTGQIINWFYKKAKT